MCCCITGLIAFSPCLLIPCYCVCKAIAKENREWDKAFRAWQDDFNNQILQNCGIFVKTQSRCDAVYISEQGRTRKERHIERWLAFALTPEEVAKLKAEPHEVGDIEDCKCCGGSDEHELCMHP